MHRSQRLTLPLLLAAVTSGCLNDTDGLFTARIQNDSSRQVHVDECDIGADDCTVRKDANANIEEGRSKRFVVGEDRSGSFRLSTREGEVLGCIPWAFEDYLKEGSTIFKVSQMVDCDETEPVEPHKSGTPVEGF